MKILLIGSQGRMGKQMQKLLRDKNVEFFGIDKTNREDAKNYKPNVVLDFSSSDCLYENLELAKQKQIPIVIATTNHGEENLKLIEEYKKHIPIFLSSNFSLMFNVFLNTLKNFRLLQDCDFAITETHHKNKKDAPSGSCKEILKRLEKYNIHPQVSSFRVGDVVGIHELSIYSQNECLEIKHQVLDRQVFCEGALKACEFILSKSNNLYTMQDLMPL